jgi:hypothetical protein
MKRFGVGLAGMALACFGLANRAGAGGGSINPCNICMAACQNGGYTHQYCRQRICSGPCGPIHHP